MHLHPSTGETDQLGKRTKPSHMGERLKQAEMVLWRVRRARVITRPISTGPLDTGIWTLVSGQMQHVTDQLLEPGKRFRNSTRLGRARPGSQTAGCCR